jgi:hypothetical protein
VRGCLFVLLLGAAVVIGSVLIAGPTVVGGAATVVLSLAGFSGEETAVDVSTDSPLELLQLHADEMRITSRDATYRDVQVGRVDVTLTDVDLGARTCDRIDGRLEDVLLVREGASAIRVRRIDIEGRTPRPAMRVTLPAAEVELLVTDAIEAASGQRPGAVSLEAPDRLTFVVGGVPVGGRLSVDSAGGLVLDPDVPVLPRSDVFRPDSTLPFRLSDFSIGDAGLELVGTLDLG